MSDTRWLAVNTRPTAMLWSRLCARAMHFLATVVPAVLILFMLGVTDPLAVRAYLALALVAGTLTVLVFTAFGIYGRHFFSNEFMFRPLLLSWSGAFGLVLVLHSLYGFIAYLPIRMLLFWYVMTLLLLFAARLLMLAFFRRSVRRGLFIGRCVILGATENGLRLAMHMRERSDIGSGLLGFIDDRRPNRLDPGACDMLLGGFQMLERMIRQNRIDQVLVALPAEAVTRNRYYADRLRQLSVKVLLVPEMGAFNYALPKVSNVADIPMLVMSEPPLQGWAPFYKRCEDIVLAALCLLLLAPLMAAVAVAIKLDSPGPVLFRQKRYGYNQKLIEVYKFRSMYADMADRDARVQTVRGDRRITRVGRLIRMTSLDELPQLFNVLAGSMSMVGPRPHATETRAANVRFEDAVAQYVARHKVKPGITGLAQIYGYRGETDTIEKIQKRVEYDLAYIENWSVWFDLYILARTVPAVLSMKSAY